ncbi:MAG: hypothetical protein GY714_23980 [Desulfobacterales bacterium]|nr:hypothetical protein [Desulfobacterales bacterium]MCP4163595.1 hypothetical protein [Deltaproteobacteria bacterium]
MKIKNVLLYILLPLILFSIYTFSYVQWRNEKIQILTESEYRGEVSKVNEKPKFFYWSTNDQTIIYIPAIWLDIYIFDLEIVEE